MTSTTRVAGEIDEEVGSAQLRPRATLGCANYDLRFLFRAYAPVPVWLSDARACSFWAPGTLA